MNQARAHRDQVHAEVLGCLSVGGPPVRRDSLFRIASTSKPVTGAAVMAVADEGLLRLDEEVDNWFPGNGRPPGAEPLGRPFHRHGAGPQAHYCAT